MGRPGAVVESPTRCGAAFAAAGATRSGRGRRREPRGAARGGEGRRGAARGGENREGPRGPSGRVRWPEAARVSGEPGHRCSAVCFATERLLRGDLRAGEQACIAGGRIPKGPICGNFWPHGSPGHGQIFLDGRGSQSRRCARPLGQAGRARPKRRGEPSGSGRRAVRRAEKAKVERNSTARAAGASEVHREDRGGSGQWRGRGPSKRMWTGSPGVRGRSALEREGTVFAGSRSMLVEVHRALAETRGARLASRWRSLRGRVRHAGAGAAPLRVTRATGSKRLAEA